jgi:hypothetical protein
MTKSGFEFAPNFVPIPWQAVEKLKITSTGSRIFTSLSLKPSCAWRN